MTERKFTILLFYVIFIVMFVYASLLIRCSLSPEMDGGHIYVSDDVPKAVSEKLETAGSLIHTLEYDGIDPAAFSGDINAARSAAAVKLRMMLAESGYVITALQQKAERCESDLNKLREKYDKASADRGFGEVMRELVSRLFFTFLYVVAAVAVTFIFIRYGADALKSIIPWSRK